ncbi:sperm acrosome-associated protein 7 isoform X1 [Mustela erminea]|uniref:sperm acrosome-associated protein 7 isoform X1 n=1 Tax=Mustela erminea TaxID=36723 RepID=UPI00138678C0|nr:sperm acrosome-associated protein 7 isoform X1 [Mustela erminea]
MKSPRPQMAQAGPFHLTTPLQAGPVPGRPGDGQRTLLEGRGCSQQCADRRDQGPWPLGPDITGVGPQRAVPEGRRARPRPAQRQSSEEPPLALGAEGSGSEALKGAVWPPTLSSLCAAPPSGSRPHAPQDPADSLPHLAHCQPHPNPHLPAPSGRVSPDLSSSILSPTIFCVSVGCWPSRKLILPTPHPDSLYLWLLWETEGLPLGKTLKQKIKKHKYLFGKTKQLQRK